MKIAFGYRAVPFALASYFRHALEKRLDVELFTFGNFSGQHIDWNGGLEIPIKYPNHVNLPLPISINRPTWQMVKNKLPWTPDLVICCDAGFHLANKPDVPYATILTDPHVLGDWYKNGNSFSDFVFNMQANYMQDGNILLPYCCSPDHHYAMSVEKDYDASLIGLHYQQRDALVNALRGHGYKVLYTLGLIYDEYREQNNRATIGLNWSSLLDINARFFEIMAMKQVLLTNRLPHIQDLGYEEDRHYLGFDTVEEAISKVQWIKSNPELAQTIALNGYTLTNEKHTYEIRCETILKTVGLL